MPISSVLSKNSDPTATTTKKRDGLLKIVCNEWKQAISKVNGKPASLASHVCELHFGPNDISRSFSVWNNETVEDVLEETISWLNDWESHFIKGNIKKDEFLTNSTANGLRVTMKSTIDLSKYLLETCDFKYVLTNKMNQDRLEQFFGTIRQSISPNDHPTCPSFLQVYKLLTVYSIIKPPKTGNCQILDPSTSMITLSDLKELFNSEPSERQIKINRLKQLLDSMVEESDWNFNVDLAFQDHTYSTKIKVATKECVLYYICGYVSKQIQKHTKCNVCLSAFKGTDWDAQLPEAALTNLKTKGYLLYPNKHFFKLITAIEEGFVKFAQDPEVFNKTIDYVII
ncbi:hypothetical protein ACI65C_009678 [Semiaphis heraclei]